MNILERFIKIPVVLYDHQEVEITGNDFPNCVYLNSFKKINPLKIIAYEPAIPKGKDVSEENLIWTNVYMENGDEFYCTLTVREFEILLINFG